MDIRRYKFHNTFFFIWWVITAFFFKLYLLKKTERCSVSDGEILILANFFLLVVDFFFEAMGIKFYNYCLRLGFMIKSSNTMKFVNVPFYFFF